MHGAFFCCFRQGMAEMSDLVAPPKRPSCTESTIPFHKHYTHEIITFELPKGPFRTKKTYGEYKL